MNAWLQPYLPVRDSGVTWLGVIPRHWDVQRLKAGVCNVVDQVSAEHVDASAITLEDVEGWTGRIRRRPAIPFDSTMKRFRANDVLFGKLRPYLAKVARASMPGLCVGEFLVLRPRDDMIAPTYLAHLMRSKPVIDEVSAASFGAKMPRAEWDFVGTLRIPIPPADEQAAIVRFLDHADQRIKRAIHAKQKLIALLHEQRQAVIHRAATRGLDPHVSLVASDVDWIGGLPAHWNTARIASLFQERVESGRPELPILAVSIESGVTAVGETAPEGRPRKFLEERASYKVAAKGDIAYNTMRMWQGAAGVVPEDGLISPAYVVCAPRSECNADYYAMLFRTDACKGAIVGKSRGIADDRNRLYWDAFKTLRVPVPPAEEQADIVAVVAANTAATTKAIGRTQLEIELFREYRMRLIADAVTGKLDVRDAATRLPDEIAESEPLDQIDIEPSGDLEDDLEEVEA